MDILLTPDALASRREELERVWRDFSQSSEAIQSLLQVGKYSQVDLDFHDGHFAPGGHSWTSGPDDFEVEIGNLLVYSVPLWECGDYFRRLQSQWLPYYDEALRRDRLAMVRCYCLNNLHHVPLYVERELYFQSFRRLWHAFGEFLQALFIARRVYPIAYDKWVREQVEDILGLRQLYAHLPHLFEITHFESRQMAEKARQLEALVEEYIVE